MKAFICLFLLVSNLHAHIVEQLFADFSRTEQTWTLKLRFDAGLALPQMRQNEQAPQPTHSWLISRSPEQLAELKQETTLYLQQYLLPTWTSNTEDTLPLDFTTHFPAWQTSPPAFTLKFIDTGFAYYDVIISGSLPAPAGTLNLSIAKGNHPDLAIGFSNGNILTAYPAKPLTLISLTQSAPTETESFLNFLDYGFRHVIPEGWDHVLFILALVCLTFAWKPLLTQSLIFTTGHTITLGLVVTGMIATPAPLFMKWIEVLIAATILYVAIGNIMSKNVRAHRLVMVFIFGLIHGLGFASVLGDKIRASADIAMPLIAANLGVELGQITVIAATLVALFWARKKSYFAIILKTISTLISLTASYWVVERMIS